MASSTRAPTAIASPPNVMVFTVIPKFRITARAVTSESGSASNVITAARRFARKTLTMRTTRSPPSRNAAATFRIATSMKSAWRKICFEILIPWGSAACRSSRTASNVRVRSRVLALGCLRTPRMTAGLALWDPSPRLMGSPILTLAICPMLTGCPPRTATGIAAMFSGFVTRPRP